MKVQAYKIYCFYSNRYEIIDFDIGLAGKKKETNFRFLSFSEFLFCSCNAYSEELRVSRASFGGIS